MSSQAPTLDLDTPYALTDEQIRQFREDGFVKLKGVLSPDVIDYYGQEITQLTMDHNPLKGKAIDDRDTYGKAFIQVGNLWQKGEKAKAFAFSKRMARIAAELMGTRGTRMWHDQALYKEAGGGFTPWHADQQYWPMGSAMCCTIWAPLQAVPIDMGPMCFGKGTHLKNMGRDIEISDESEAKIKSLIKEHGIIEMQEPYDLGEVSVHWGWTLHRAGPNTTGTPRKVHTIIYMDQDMTLAKPKNQNQQNDWDAWTPSTKIGEVMDDALNPVLWSRDEE